jgi:hypothetical protein
MDFNSITACLSGALRINANGDALSSVVWYDRMNLPAAFWSVAWFVGASVASLRALDPNEDLYRLRPHRAPSSPSDSLPIAATKLMKPKKGITVGIRSFPTTLALRYIGNI